VQTVDYRLRHEQDAIYRVWRKAWDALLSPSQDSLIKFMVDDLNVEVHESGSGRSLKSEAIPMPTVRPEQAGLMHAIGVPMFAVSNNESPAVVYKPGYYFTIDGMECRAVDTCAEYLKLIEQIVGKFKMDHP
jgi:hypothetical protein